MVANDEVSPQPQNQNPESLKSCTKILEIDANKSMPADGFT